MIEKNKSPYTSITGCTFLYYEFGRILPLLMDANSEALLKDEIENNRVLQVNSIASRKRFVVEFKRRYDALPFLFWQSWQNMSEAGIIQKKQQWAITPLLLILYYCTILKRIRNE